MAKTKKGNKKVHVPAHTKKVNGKEVKVSEFKSKLIDLSPCDTFAKPRLTLAESSQAE